MPKKINGEELKERLSELYKKLKEPAKKVPKEQKRKMKNDPFLVQNLFYNKEQDFYPCPMGQRMENIGSGKRTSSNRYKSQVSYYQSKRCDNCPLRGQCHQSKVDRRIEVNHRLNELKQKARTLLTSAKGLKHRSKRPMKQKQYLGNSKVITNLIDSHSKD